MRPSDLAVILPYLERAVGDIDHYLAELEEHEKAERELYEWCYLMEADNEWKRWENEGGLIAGEESSFSLRSALAGRTDEGWAALQITWRVGWRESSHQAAVRLRKAKETVGAGEIDLELSGLPDKPREATEIPSYLEAMRTAAERVRVILTIYFEEQPLADAIEVKAREFKAEDNTAGRQGSQPPKELEPHFDDDEVEPVVVSPKYHKRLLESRVLKKQYKTNSVDLKIVKRAKGWFGRDWNTKAKADGKAWQERFHDLERQELIAFKSFFESKWKN